MSGFCSSVYCRHYPNYNVLIFILREVVFDGLGDAKYEKTFKFAQNKRNVKYIPIGGEEGR